MVFKLGSNVVSLTVQRNLSRSTQDLSTASERLASGQRINRASDDAAGLAISMSLNIDSRVFTQGVRNLNDGLSAVTIADAAINELTSITQRIEELAVQSMNGTFTDTQRGSMQREVTALQAEWNRTVESTTFNGLNLLTGSGTGMVLQGGKGVEGTLAVQIGSGSIGGTTRVSTDSAGNQATNTSGNPAISADGRFVVFQSSASNLVAGDTNNRIDIFVKDVLSGATTRVSTDSAGTQANNYSSVGGISADGRFVSFSSRAANLVSGDTNVDRDVFLKDTLTGVTTRLSTDSAGNQGDSYSYFGAISADGRFIAFTSNSSNLVAGDSNGVRDAFIKDTVTNITTRISTDRVGNEANGYSTAKAISADGRYVVFVSNASNLVSGDTNGQTDVFIKDLLTGVTNRVSTDSAGNQGDSFSGVTAVISGDGRFVAFDSASSNLVSGDTNAQMDVFIKDTATGQTTRASTDSAGTEAPAFSTVGGISADGRFVLFNSIGSKFVANDTNGSVDSFSKDMLTGMTTRLSTDSQMNQASGGDSYSTAISADARFAVFYSSASNLVSDDTNFSSDIFLKDLTKLGVQTMAGMVVSNRVSAGITLGLVQRYRNELLQYRSNIGASTQRIQSFVSNLGISSENFKAAESRVVDADIAAEAAESLRLQILRQSATSLLRQANLAPQIALDLLRNA